MKGIAVQLPVNVALQNALPLVRAAGASCVEVSSESVQRDLQRARDAAAAIHTLLDEHGLSIVALSVSPTREQPATSLCDQVAALRGQMILAQELGLDAINLGAGNRRGQSLDKLVLSLDALLPKAEELGMTVNLANHRGTRVEQLDDLRYVFMNVRPENLRLMIDAGQFQESAVNPRDVLREFADRTSVVRLGDRIGRRQTPVGQGEMNAQAVLEELRHGRFEGWLVLEAPADPKTDLVVYFQEALRFTNTILDS